MLDGTRVNQREAQATMLVYLCGWHSGCFEALETQVFCWRVLPIPSCSPSIDMSVRKCLISDLKPERIRVPSLCVYYTKLTRLRMTVLVLRLLYRPTPKVRLGPSRYPAQELVGNCKVSTYYDKAGNLERKSGHLKHRDSMISV